VLNRALPRVTIAALLLSAAVLAVPTKSSAAPGPACVPECLWVNGDPGPEALRQYTMDGQPVHTAELTRPFFDIALSPDGQTLYGVDGSVPGLLFTIDQQTGASDAGLPLSGPAATRIFNGMTTLRDGRLLAATYAGRLFTINPATGTSSRFRTDLPAGYGNSGDLQPLDGGDLLAVVVKKSDLGGPDYLVRIHRDNSATIVGAVPTTYGVTVVGCTVVLASADGLIRGVDAVPVAPSTEPLDTFEVAAPGMGELLGAAAVPSAAQCRPTASPDRARTDVDTPVDIAVLDNDSAAEYLPLDPSTVRLLDRGRPVHRLRVSGQGVFTAHPAGEVTFAPAPGFTGHVRTVGYEVLDTAGHKTRSTIDVVVAGPTLEPAPDPRPDPDPEPDIPHAFPAGLDGHARADSTGGAAGLAGWALGGALGAVAVGSAALVGRASRRRR
jgi:hypothetical protein